MDEFWRHRERNQEDGSEREGKRQQKGCQISTFLVLHFLENLSKTSLKIYAKLLNKKILLASQSAIQLDI